MESKDKQEGLEINENKINDENNPPEDDIKTQSAINFQNKYILLIFNKISNEYTFNIKRKKKILITKKEEEKKIEEKKEEKNDQNNNAIEEPKPEEPKEEKKEEPPKEEEKKEEPPKEEQNKIKEKNEIKEEEKKEDKDEENPIVNLLEKELDNTNFNDLIEAQNNIIGTILKDYYLYFVTRNETLERETDDLENLCRLLEIICEFQFEFNKKDKLTKKDLLSLIIWTIDYNNELNEFLYCVEYFKKEKIFKKKNIFQEIFKRLKNIDIEKDDIKETIGLKKGMEIILSAINDLCIDDPQSLSKVIDIIPNMYHIEQKYKLNSKEIYFLREIKYIYKLIKKLNLKNDENVIGQILRQKLIPCRYLYKENSERLDAYNSLVSSLIMNIKKDDPEKNDKYRYIIKILVQEYKKCYKDNKILDVLIKLMDNKNLLKVSQYLFHEILSQYFDGTELIFDKITNYNTDDYFLKLISNQSNSLYFEQILLEVFESKFNAHFMSYTNEINNTIKYEDLSKEQAELLLKGKNLENFKKCIEMLEDKNIRESNQRFLPNIVYCAYIKEYLYQFISYVFKKANEPINLEDIINSLTNGNNEVFKSKETKVMEIYSFRILLNYLNQNFDNFKNYNFDEKGLLYEKSFKNDGAFDDQIPKIIEFCARTIEDFINSKGETPLEKEEEQNFYTNSFLSVKIVTNALNQNGISINSNEYKEIWDYFRDHLLSKKFYINYNNNNIYLEHFLVDILINQLKSKLSNDSYGLGSFQNDQDLTHLNNKTLGMIIYIIRFCLHSYTIQGGYNKDGKTEKFFYSKLIDYDTNEDINEYIKKCYIPGRLNENTGIQKIDLNTFCLDNNDHNNKITNEEPKLELISILMMRFLFYSHLFFRNLLGKLDESTFSSNYSINEGYSSLRMLISLWNKLNSNDMIPGNESNKVEIFLNRVNKEIVQEYKLCKDFDNKENVKKFEESFNKYIIKCRNEYDYFKLIYVNKTMKSILQESNFPLSYETEHFPFMKYFVLISNPNIEDLKQKIRDNVENKQLYLTDTIMNYDEKLKDEKFENFIKNNKLNKLYLILTNIYSLSPNIYKTSDINLSEVNKEIIEKYKDYFTDFNKKKILDLNNSINDFADNLIKSSMKFLGKFIKKLKKKNNYLYKSIRRPILWQSSIDNESIIFDIDKISKYKSYPHLLSKYIYKDIFMEEKEKICDFIDLEIKIDYVKYKEFNIDVEGFEDELISIILPYKRIFYDNDYSNKIVYNFDTFRKNNNLLNTFIIKYQDCLEETNCEEKIKNIIKEKNVDINQIYIDKIIGKFDEVLCDKILGNKKYEELDIFNKLIIDQYKNIVKNELIKKLNESLSDELQKALVFDFSTNLYFNLLKIINYLIQNIIPGEISLNDIITNLPVMLNISDYTKYFFKSNKEYKLKNLYSIFEEFEKNLFPFILLHVYEIYKQEIFDENKENIINYFDLNKDKIKETKFTKRHLIDALRKFISRYLTSSDINNEYKNKNEDGEDTPPHTPLINYLNRCDIWPLNIYYNKIENGFNKLKKFNFLVKHSVDLYKCLSGISFDDNGKIEKEEEIAEIDESEKEYNYYKDISYFNDKNILTKPLSFNYLYNNNIDYNKFFNNYNLGNIYIDYINKDNPNEEISVLALSNSNNGLYCSKWKYKFDNTFKIEEYLKKENSVLFDNNKLADIQNITCLKIMKNNEFLCFGTNNAKLKIIKLKDNYSNIELIQELALKGDSVCINNIVEFNNNKTLITSDEKHILVFEKNEEDNNYNTYNEKKDINTENKTYILKVDEHTLAAFIYPNIIKFYNIDNYEFKETVINEIKSDINLSDQKQFKMMNLIGKNNNILGVCSNEHSIYLIDINDKKLIKNCTFEGYNNNFVSISKFNDDNVLLLDSNKNLLLCKLEMKEDKVDDLKLTGLLKQLTQDYNSLCTFPYGINHFYFDGTNIEFKYNELN